MNCDTAFDLMTDAEGSRSLALARHLDDCPRCRQMQATLSPALDFLVETRPADGAHESAIPHSATASAGRRQPIVTAEALRIAQQTAIALRDRTESPRIRMQRLAGRTLQYSAVFAAGLLVALMLFEVGRGTGPGDRECTRYAAVTKNPQRTSAEIQALQLSCARCHNPSESPREKSSSTIQSSRRADELLLERLLSQETLVAIRGSTDAGAAREIG
jgi:hypothetical protein